MKEHEDVLPKFICVDCWIKSKYFHDFYNTVAEAKSVFLKNSVKSEEPTFFEINCNSPRYDFDIPSVKVEPINDIETENIQPSADNFLEIEHKSPSNDYSIELASDNGFGDDPHSVGNGSDDDCEDMESAGNAKNVKVKCEEKFEVESASIFERNTDDTLSATAAAELATQIFKKTTSKLAMDEFTRLIPEYFDMICEICKHKFKTLNQAYTHTRFKHDNVKIKVNCCPQRIPSADLRDHILYHLNPDVFK